MQHGQWWGNSVGGRSTLFLCSQGCQLTIDVLLWLQWMPLGNGATRVSQHVRPVLQTQACCLTAHKDLPNGVILTNFVIIKHCDHDDDFLQWQQKDMYYLIC